MSDLSNYRKSYEKSALIETAVPEDPIALFTNWFCEIEAVESDVEVNAMTVATIGLDGYPRTRIVLLKQFNENGFIFYTNYESEKGKAITANPNVCLSFFWPALERQVIIKGTAEKVAANLSDGYFDSRPNGSKLGALVSRQSEVIPSRASLEAQLLQLERDFAGKDIPRPDYWGGFLVRPIEMEFWQGRPNRLHDRLRYKVKNNLTWQLDRLAP